MTANTGAPWSLVYQTYSDPADISDAVRDLADSADVAVQTLYNDAALGAAKPAARMATTTAQSIPDNTSTDLTWPAGSEYYDNDGMIDNTITTNRITFQRTGIYMVSIRATFDAVAGSGMRQISVTSSALGIVARRANVGITGAGAVVHILIVFPVFAVGQFATFQALHTSGVATDVLTRQAQAFRLSPL